MAPRTRKTLGKKARATGRKAAPRRAARKASAKSATDAAAAPAPVAAVDQAAGAPPPPSIAAPQGVLADVARTIGSTLGAIAATARGALHKGKRGKKNT